MQAEQILKIIRDNPKYFVFGYFIDAMAKGVKSYTHLKNLSDIKAQQVARAVFKKLLGEELGGL